MSYKQFTLWLSEDERADMIDEIRRVIATRITNNPASGRTQHLLSLILFPTEKSYGR